MTHPPKKNSKKRDAGKVIIRTADAGSNLLKTPYLLETHFNMGRKMDAKIKVTTQYKCRTSALPAKQTSLKCLYQKVILSINLLVYSITNNMIGGSKSTLSDRVCLVTSDRSARTFWRTSIYIYMKNIWKRSQSARYENWDEFKVSL